MTDSNKVSQMVWDQVQSRSSSGNHPLVSGHPNRPIPKLMVCSILFVSLTYLLYTLKLLTTSAQQTFHHTPFTSYLRRSTSFTSAPLVLNQTAVTAPPHHGGRDVREKQKVVMQMEQAPPKPKPTEIHDVVFGIAASSKLWQQRKEYIKIWYKPNQMRGVVWLDDRVKYSAQDNRTLPPFRVSSDTSKFPYTNRKGHRSAIRISRIVTETLRMKMDNVRWFVMGDDDTVFITANLVRILRKYDHTQYYYIGSLSESHIQNIFFSYGMAYGGGGFAISYPLAKALAKMQDRCIQRYPGLYGSDDRMQACMAELGVPLTKELGFHQILSLKTISDSKFIAYWFMHCNQYDVYGNLLGLLAAHPVTPLVSLHHLDVVEPIFPNVSRVQALQRLMLPTKLDSAGIMQQSICYDKTKSWTISVSWGFAVQVFRGIFSPREIEMPSRTFLNWYKRADYTAYAFNTRPVSRNPCQKPFVFYMSSVRMDSELNKTVSEYERHHVPHPLCRWKMANPNDLETVIVHKKPDPHLWDRSPRKNCCRAMESKERRRMVIDVGVCKDGEVSEI
ncbi:Beta-1,3-N-acetylglucosaminyltransferase lunatic fringe [Gossypium arboreum]|uniref:Beta-1,3-N-acetylglucosaminyltransferase lunatic fringe n=1 Tax=Gossypium arboreum TaxID=29729 RepID=A0A0B0P0Y1_GOSAR|nr:Beta-1,3-N-acetylglucosaminyltransferase lunatic fringe [Gossypium arboreum]